MWDQILLNFYIEETLLEGHVYFDANQNGTRDSLENGIASQLVHIVPGGTILQTDYNGKYSGQSEQVRLLIHFRYRQTFILTTPFPTYSITVPPDDTIGNDFGLFTPTDTVMVHNFIVNTG